LVVSPFWPILKHKQLTEKEMIVMGIQQTFIRLGRDGQSILYEPETLSDKSRIAIVAMHVGADYLTFPLGPEMAAKGYRVLCANASNNSQNLDQKMLDLGLAVSELRKRRDISKVVLMGHSGGATLMSAYQNVAENGPDVFRGPEKLIQCSDDLIGLSPADGMMLLDANFGNGAMTLFSLDPGVVNEDNGQRIDEKLNLLNPANGFREEGTVYPVEFVRAFQKAQGERNRRLIRTALDRLSLIEAGKGRFTDDEPFVVPGGSQLGYNNKLFAQDTRLLSHTKKPRSLLKAGGAVVEGIVPSVRKPKNFRSHTGSYHTGAMVTTVKNFLISNAVMTTDDYGFNEDSLYGIDWTSSYCCPPGNIREVSVPLLIMGMTGGWEYLASEIIHEYAPAGDKTLMFVEGASHNFTTARECEGFPGEFGDTQKNTFDYADTWLSKPGRFM
jgi:pimeloyl-ACP methyl ester carboxylesterase